MPGHIFKNVPFSLALRLVRICSEQETLNKRLDELKEMLTARKYNRNVIKAAIEKAKNKERKEALKRAEKKKNERVVFALTYHPKLPSISKILKTHWTTMCRNDIRRE